MPDPQAQLDQLRQAVRELFAAEKQRAIAGLTGQAIEALNDRLRESRRRLVELVEETK